jgi:hypothetical protein
MDGVWLPAGGRQPRTRGLPGSRHIPGPGIAKGEAFSPLARRRSPEVNPIASACQAEPDQADSKSEIRNPDSTAKNMTGLGVNVGLRPTQPNLQIAAAPVSKTSADPRGGPGPAAPTARRCRPQSAGRSRAIARAVCRAAPARESAFLLIMAWAAAAKLFIIALL